MSNDTDGLIGGNDAYDNQHEQPDISSMVCRGLGV